MYESIARIVAVGVGGGIGSALRYVLGGVVQRASDAFPIGTMAVNVTGCLAIGFLAERFGETTVDPLVRTGVLIGVLGGYTTFSSFSLDSLKLAADRQFLAALINVMGTVAACLTATWAGQRLAKWMAAG
ncbi:MAG: fluoride efflux transporter CrcB [Planctomycetota bacterium]